MQIMLCIYQEERLAANGDVPNYFEKKFVEMRCQVSEPLILDVTHLEFRQGLKKLIQLQI